MRVTLGEEGTEQFRIRAEVDGETVMDQSAHDPFINARVVIQLPWWARLLAVVRPRPIVISVHVEGSPGAQEAIMNLDPRELAKATRDILAERAKSRENSGIMGWSN